nr:hypothetical protein [Tanacetum cinerariifolium]
MSSVVKVNKRLRNTIYGYFFGKKIAFPVVENYVFNVWGKFSIQKVMMNGKGFYFLKFSSMKRVDNVLENKPWMIRQVPIILNKWPPSTSLTKENHSSVPIWVKMHNVPMAAFMDDGLSFIASKTLANVRLVHDGVRMEATKVFNMQDFWSSAGSMTSYCKGDAYQEGGRLVSKANVSSETELWKAFIKYGSMFDGYMAKKMSINRQTFRKECKHTLNDIEDDYYDDYSRYETNLPDNDYRGGVSFFQDEVDKSDDDDSIEN